MRILWVATAFYPEVRQGGNVTQAWEECRALVRGGASVTVFTTQLSESTTGTTEQEIEGIRVRYFARTAGYWRAFSLALTRSALRGAGDFDVVHLNSPWQLANPFASAGARMAGVPWVVSLRGTMMPWAFNEHQLRKGPYFQLIERHVIGGSAALIASNAREREISTHRWPRVPVRVVPPVVDVNRFRTDPGFRLRATYAIAPDAPLIFFIGRNHPVKGLDLLLHAFKRVIRDVPTARLLIAGPEHRGTQGDAARLADQLGIASAVAFAGMLSEDEKVAAFHDADLVVMPSRQEGFGQVAAEAMAAGRPVIVTSETGIAALVTEADAGLVVPVDSDAIAGAIIGLSLDADRRAELGAHGAAFAALRFARTSISDQLLELYRNVAPRLR